ncbi:hypothetical protein Tco_1247995 [Tanacetum coccineum]
MMRLLSMRNDRSNMKVEEESPQSVKMGVWESIHRRYRDGWATNKWVIPLADGYFDYECEAFHGCKGYGYTVSLQLQCGAFLVEYLMNEHSLFGGLTRVCAAAWCGKVVIAPGQGNADAKCDLDEDKIRMERTGEVPMTAQIESDHMLMRPFPV